VRQLSGWRDKAIGTWLVALSLFHLYTATFGIMQPRVQRGVHLLCILPLAFLLFSSPKDGEQNDSIGVTDLILAGLSIFPPLYVILANDQLTMRLSFIDPVSPLQMGLGVLMILLLLEAIRRAVVPALAILIAVFLGYMFIAPYLSGVFHSSPPTLAEIVEMQYLISEAGIFGSITGVSATFVAIFVIFGSFMENTGTGRFFTNLACRVAGRGRGGPAKIAVISSGLFGSISGVGAANVYTTGTFTIPMMIRLGYRRQFAGAVEAAASTGGMLMPPVMGAGAFVMAEITGIAYVHIVLAAMLGAVLYYVSLVLRVHLTALKEDLRGVDNRDMVSFAQLGRDSYLLLPLLVLVAMLLKGYSPFMAANVSIGVTFVLSFLRAETRMSPARLWQTLRSSGHNMIMIGLACAGAGMVVSIVTNTGLALGIATVINSWSGGILLIALVLIMLTSLLLGMGLPCTPAYIIAVTIGGPALQAMGCDLLATHLFVFYFAILAGITPPVCIPAFCGAAIAGSKPLQTGFEAFKLAVVGFLIPYVFIYNQALLLHGTAAEIVSLVLVLLVSIVLLAGGLSGYLGRRLSEVPRLLVLALAVSIALLGTSPDVVNTWPSRIISSGFLLGVIALAWWRKRRSVVA
jgi:TRAP transporter 4TM/12TM fusion protein